MFALFLLVLLIILIAARVPAAFAIMLSGLIGLLVMLPFEGVVGVMEVVPDHSVQKLALSAVPLFVLMAHFMLLSGMMDSLFGAAKSLFGRTPGGSGVASVLAGVGFSSVSGSSTAAAATLAQTTTNQMIKEGYRPTTATGIVASVGTLAGMIPPSVVLVFYAVTAQANVGDIIIAGLIPGLIIAAALTITMFLPIFWDRGSFPRGKPARIAEKARKVVGVVPAVILFIAVVGAIYTGVATPTEAAAIGSFVAFLFALASGNVTLSTFIRAVVETVKTSAMILTIVVAAHVFGHAFARTRAASSLVDWVSDLAVPAFVIMLILMVMYVILGFFMDQIAIIALTVPIVLPVVVALGYDPIWFGVFVVLMAEIGLISPPLGINALIVSRVSGRETLEVFRGSVPYAAAMLVVGVLFIVWPEIVLWLPNTM